MLYDSLVRTSLNDKIIFTRLPSKMHTIYNLPRTSNSTVGFHQILSEKLSDPIGIRRKLSESLASDSDRKLLDLGKCQNGPVS